ncbi:MAG TPA: hypothetical protein VLJ62_18380, partial [Burkholderiaceae bacterium]|nr:hypothetical protein [Burkholderiaceae bacterium]
RRGGEGLAAAGVEERFGLRRLQRRVQQLVQARHHRRRCVRRHVGGEPFATTPEQLAKFQGEETAKWGRVIKKAGIEAE